MASAVASTEPNITRTAIPLGSTSRITAAGDAVALPPVQSEPMLFVISRAGTDDTANIRWSCTLT